jgi:hypothetical protein
MTIGCISLLGRVLQITAESAGFAEEKLRKLCTLGGLCGRFQPDEKYLPPN